MITRREAVGGIGASMLLGGCSRRLPTYRYRMTVEVDTPQGLRSGSSVIEVHTVRGSGIPDTARSTRTRGEGAAVDLPGGLTLFALLRGEGTYGADHYAPNAYEPVLTQKLGPLGKDASWDAWLHELSRQRKPAVLPRRLLRPANNEPWLTYPLLVQFRDIRDPRSVKAVDPDDLGASFGPGTKLKRIVIEITDAPISATMKDRLPWLPHYYNKMLDGERYNSSERLNNKLMSGSFSAEGK